MPLQEIYYIAEMVVGLAVIISIVFGLALGFLFYLGDKYLF